MKRLAPLGALLLAACITEHVSRADVRAETLCVQRNPMTFPEFLDVFVSQLRLNGYDTKVVDAAEAAGCPVLVTYAATRNAHWGPYLATAHIDVRRGDDLIGQVRYRARKGALLKHGGTASRIRALASEVLPARPA